MLLAEKKMEEIWRNRKEKCKAGNTSRREPSGMPFREISPKFEITFGGIRHARNPWRQKRQLTQPPNQPRKCTKHSKTSDNQTCTHASCWKEGWRNGKETCKAGNTSRKEPSGMPFREISPKFEVILAVFGMLGTPRNKEGSWHNHPTSPENGQHDKFNDNHTHTCFLLKRRWKKFEEIERRNARLGTLPGESPVECQVHQVVEPNPPLQLEMARFDKTEKTERFVNQTATARSLMNLILETTSAVKAFKGSGNTFIKSPAVAINASHQKLFRNNCLAFDPSLDNYFHGVWSR